MTNRKKKRSADFVAWGDLPESSRTMLFTALSQEEVALGEAAQHFEIAKQAVKVATMRRDAILFAFDGFKAAGLLPNDFDPYAELARLQAEAGEEY